MAFKIQTGEIKFKNNNSNNPEFENTLNIFTNLEAAKKTDQYFDELEEKKQQITQQISSYTNLANYYANEASNSANRAMSGTQEGYAAFVGSMAPTYSTSSGYAIGDYVLKNGQLYRCIVGIGEEGENWTSEHWITVTAGEEISRAAQGLKLAGLARIPFLYTNYYYKTDESSVNIASPVPQNYFDCTWVSCSPGDTFTITGTTALVSGGGIRSAIWTFIDSEGAVIPDAQETGTEVVGKIITAPENAAMLVLNNRKHGQTITPSFYYGSRIQEINTELENIRDEMVKYPQGHVGKNKFYNIDLVNGHLTSATTIDSSGTTYKTTDYIDVSGFTSGHISVSPRIRKWAEYLADKTPNISAGTNGYHDLGGMVSNKSLELDDNTAFVRISLRSEDIGTVQIEDHDGCTTYEAPMLIFDDIFGLNDRQKQMVREVSESHDLLYGKKWAVCGDSFTAGADSGTLTKGKYIGQKIVYPFIIANRNNMTIYNFFLNGRTLAYPSDRTFDNALTAPGQACNYQNIPQDADYITIYLGINDYHHYDQKQGPDGESITGLITLGTIHDADEHDPEYDPSLHNVGTSTYYGAWNTVMTWLRENRPKAHIGIIVSNGIPASSWREAQIAIATKYGVPYMDMNGDQHTPCMLRSCNAEVPEWLRTEILKKQCVRYQTEGNLKANWHPNNETHYYESTFIENFLRSL